MVDQPKKPARMNPSKEPLVIKVSGGSLTQGSLMTLERFAWLQGKTILVEKDGAQYTIPQLREEFDGDA
jgi:hypothetical protein